MITVSREHITLITTHEINIQQVYTMNNSRITTILSTEAISIPQDSVTGF